MDRTELRNRLDRRYAKIIRAIDTRGGQASTSEIKALTGIDTNQVITQRMDRLAEWGLVTTSYRSVDSDSQRLPTKVATLTPSGQTVADDEILIDGLLSDDSTIQDVSKLNARINHVERRVGNQQKRLEKFIELMEIKTTLSFDELTGED